MKLKTKLKSSTDEIYTAKLFTNDQGKTILSIIPTSNIGGCWKWRLETLLKVDGYGNKAPSDTLYLGVSQDWYVTGMRELYREILNEVIKCQQ